VGPQLVRLRQATAARAAAVLLLVTAGAVGCGSSSKSSASCPAAVPSPAAAASIHDTPPPVPRSGAYLGAFALNGTTFTQSAYITSTAALETSICRPLDIVHSYLQWQKPFPADSELAASRSGQIILLSWTGTDLAQMASGADDSEIRAVAAEVAALHSPVFVELRWEMDRPNLASIVHSPGTFIAAWDHTRAIFAAVGVTNASWVWCPTATGFDRGTAEAYYPGASQVDWICTDAYPRTTGPFEGLAAELASFLTWARQQGKPLMLGEIGVPESYTADERTAWFNGAADFIEKTAQIKALVYFDYNPAGHSANRDYFLAPDSAAIKGLKALGARSWFSPKMVPTTEAAP
jgi:hypothetical protein